MSEVRLQKIIASSGLASRREAERLITSGRVLVNGRVVTTLGTKVDPQRDKVNLDGKPVQPTTKKLYLMLNKPRSVVSTISDPQGRTTIVNFLEGLADARGSNRVFHVGRLDYASEGLLLLTNDGQLAQALSHPSSQVPRTYLVRVRGCPSKAVLNKIQQEIMLEDGLARVADIQKVKRSPKSTWLELTVTEGRNRLVRRTLAAVNLHIYRLIRIAYGGIELGDLPTGKARALTSEELKTLRKWER